jgi:hypothetical protein
MVSWLPVLQELQKTQAHYYHHHIIPHIPHGIPLCLTKFYETLQMGIMLHGTSPLAIRGRTTNYVLASFTFFRKREWLNASPAYERRYEPRANHIIVIAHVRHA